MDFSAKKSYQTHGDGSFRREDFRQIGRNVILEAGTLVFHPENIVIGDNVYVGHRTILKGYHARTLTIGEDSWIGQDCFLHSAGGIRIGRAVGIGPKVMILSSSHDMSDVTIPILFHDIAFAEVVVGDGSDIGIGTIILPGTTIGEGAVIGAGSVVTRDIPPHTVATGNPIKILRDRRQQS